MAATTTAVAADYTALVQSIYISYFGRPADTVGLANYTAQLAALNAPLTMKGILESTSVPLKTLVNSFGSSAESVALYGTDTIAFVKAIYTNVLNRAADFDGLVYWATEIDAGRLTKAAAALNIAQGALVNTSVQGKIDAATLTNKVAIATNFTKDIDTPEELSAYSGAAAATIARDMLKTVTSTTVAADFQATVTATVAALVTAAAPVVPPVVGQTFTLTTSATDVSNGTTGNDTFIGQVGQSTTLQASDTINGKGGSDTLRIVTDTATAQSVTGFTVTNVQTLEVQAQAQGAGTTIGMENVTGATTVRSSSSSGALTLNQVKNIVDLDIVNTLGASNLTVSYQAVAIAGTADTQKLALNGNTMGVVDIAGVETLAITATTKASTIATVTAANLTTLTAAGDQLVTITAALPTTVKTVTSTQTAGGLDINLTGTQDVAVTGGAGADKVTFTGAFTSNDSFNGGAGRDTVVANVENFTRITVGGTATDTYGPSAKLSNVEIIQFADILPATGFDASKITGEDTYTLMAGFATGSMTGVSNGTTINLNAASNGATLTIPTATSLNVVLNSTGTAAVPVTDGINGSTGTGMGTIVAAAATSLTIASNGVNAATDGGKTNTHALTVTAAAATAVTMTGAEDTVLNMSGTALKTFDASATSGANTYNVAFAAGATVSGGSGSETVTASTGADVITGGAGNDSITGSGGADTITGGTGNDTFAYAALSDSTGTTVDTITDFVTGADKFSFTAAALAAGRTTISLKSGSAANFGAAQAALTLNSGVTQVVYQADTNTLWVDLNDDGTLNANDLQIKLTGVTAVTSTDVGAVVGAASTAYVATAGYDLFNATATVAGTGLSTANPLSASFAGVVGATPTLNQTATITTTAASLTALDTFAFGTATTDQITFTDAVTGLAIAATLGNATVSNLDVLQLANVTANTVTLTTVATAQATTGLTIKGGTGQDIITVAGATLLASYSLGAGSDILDFGTNAFNAITSIDLGDGNDVVAINAGADLDDGVTVVGGAGTDTIKLTGGVADVDLAKTATMETIQLVGAGGHTVALDSLAKLAGITTVTLDAGAATITQGSGMAALFAGTALAVDATVMADTATLTFGTGTAGKVAVTGLQGDIAFAGANTIGASLTMALTTADNAGATAINFANWTGAVTMTGGNALDTVTITGLATASTVTASAVAAKMDITGGAGIQTIVTGTAANTISGAAGNDVITLNAAVAVDKITFTGGATVAAVVTAQGTDTITGFGTTDTLNIGLLGDGTTTATGLATAAAGVQAALTDDTVLIINSTGTAGSLTTGSTTTLTAADFTAATLTNLAAFLSERYTTTDDAAQENVIVWNNGTTTYIYHIDTIAAGTTAIAAAEITLVGIVTQTAALTTANLVYA